MFAIVLVHPEIPTQLVDGCCTRLVSDGMMLNSPGSENKVEKNGQVWKKEKGHHPGDGALAGPAVHEDIEDEQEAEAVQQYGGSSSASGTSICSAASKHRRGRRCPR